MYSSQESSQHVPIPDYLEYFGLETDPYEEHCSGFFDEGLRSEQFSQLLHLTQFSDALLGVVGGTGLGKKTFQRELIAHLDPDDIVVDIKAPLLSNSYEIINEIANQFGVQAHLFDEGLKEKEQEVLEVLQHLKAYGSERIEGDGLKILLIEDAHNLDDQTLKALSSLSVHQLENQRCIHIVLFGEFELSERIIELENEKLLVQVFELEPLTKEELKGYLRFRLDAVGFEGIFPYKPEDIDFLWDVSQGVPAEVHEAARDILIELSSPPPEIKSIGLPIPHMALVVILVAGLLAALFYRSSSDIKNKDDALMTSDLSTSSEMAPKKITPKADSLGSEFNASRRDEIDKPELAASGLGQPIAAEVDSGLTGEVAFSEDASGKPLSQTIAGREAQGEKNIIGKIPETASDTSASISHGEKIASNKNVSKESSMELIKAIPSEIPKTTRPDSIPAEEHLMAQANRSQLTIDEAKLMALPDSLIALQLLAGGSKKAASDFVDRQPNKEDLFIYAASRGGKTLYIVVEGGYNSVEDAKRAIASLPAAQQKSGPWARSLASVKADIREFRAF
ncbi:MAG: AAA family ATPase [Cellvibrionaceae bacterium]